MGKFIPTEDLDLVLDRIALSREEAILSQDPSTYFNCIYPQLHTLDTPYVVDDCVRPGTDNGFVYECVGGGTTGLVEPAWTTVQDSEFTDGTVTWRAHENYALANAELTALDFAKSDEGNGRKVTIGQKADVLVHRGGIPATAVFINHVDQTIRYTGTRTAIIVNNQIVYPEISERNATYEFGDKVFATEISTIYYECLIAGTAGGSEPAWGTTQDEQFVDGNITWRTHVASAELVSGTLVDFLAVIFTNIVV